MLNDAVLAGFRRYLRRYAHAVLAVSRLQLPDAAGRPITLDAERLAQLDDAVMNSVVMTLFRPGTINLQKYLADHGGYPYWHCELYPSPERDYGESLHRVVLWTIYLNDNFSAGETEFFYQRRKIVPKTGSLLIAPTDELDPVSPRGSDVWAPCRRARCVASRRSRRFQLACGDVAADRTQDGGELEPEASRAARKRAGSSG